MSTKQPALEESVFLHNFAAEDYVRAGHLDRELRAAEEGFVKSVTIIFTILIVKFGGISSLESTKAIIREQLGQEVRFLSEAVDHESKEGDANCQSEGETLVERKSNSRCLATVTAKQASDSFLTIEEYNAIQSSREAAEQNGFAEVIDVSSELGKVCFFVMVEDERGVEEALRMILTDSGFPHVTRLNVYSLKRAKRMMIVGGLLLIIGFIMLLSSMFLSRSS